MKIALSLGDSSVPTAAERNAGDEGREAPAASMVSGRAQVHGAPGRQADRSGNRGQCRGSGKLILERSEGRDSEPVTDDRS
jgi:hypothetical protein